jgi:dihydrodipicolinate synthase/N-acetylneuraminate lyase
MIIAATGPWWTGQAVDYARFADLAGADAVQVFLPPYGDENALFDHFLRISKVVRGAVALHGQVPFPLLARLMTIENIVAYKEEYPGIYSVEVFSKYGDRMNIFAGGQKSHYLMYRPFGMSAYYSTFSTFDPSVPKLFWSACQRDDLAAAKAVVMKYDVPFFSRFSFSYWRAVLERYGVASRFMRPPDPTFTAEQVKDLDTFFKGLGL